MKHSPHILPAFISILTLLLTVIPCRGDKITLKNGDRLSGEITYMDPSTITINLPYAGDVHIDRSEVIKLETDQTDRLMLKDKSLTFGEIHRASEGHTVIVDSVTDAELPCSFEDIAYLNPPPHIAGEGTKFTGEANIGAEFKEGNTVSTKVTTDFRAQYDRGITRWLFNGNAQWESKNRSKTEDNWFLQGRYNELFAPQWYALGNMSLEFDEFKGLQLRSVSGGGVGYRFWDEEHKKLSLEGGPNFVYENYKDTGKSYNLSFREGLNFEYPLLMNRVFFFHNHSVLQGLTDSAQLSLRTSTGMKIPLGILGIQTSVQLDWNWDKKPSPGRQKSDTTLTLKGGYGW